MVQFIELTLPRDDEKFPLEIHKIIDMTEDKCVRGGNTRISLIGNNRLVKETVQEILDKIEKKQRDYLSAHGSPSFPLCVHVFRGKQ